MAARRHFCVLLFSLHNAVRAGFFSCILSQKSYALLKVWQEKVDFFPLCVTCIRGLMDEEAGLPSFSDVLYQVVFFFHGARDCFWVY